MILLTIGSFLILTTHLSLATCTSTCQSDNDCNGTEQYCISNECFSSRQTHGQSCQGNSNCREPNERCINEVCNCRSGFDYKGPAYGCLEWGRCFLDSHCEGRDLSCSLTGRCEGTKYYFAISVFVGIMVFVLVVMGIVFVRSKRDRRLEMEQERIRILRTNRDSNNYQAITVATGSSRRVRDDPPAYDQPPDYNSLDHVAIQNERNKLILRA